MLKLFMGGWPTAEIDLLLIKEMEFIWKSNKALLVSKSNQKLTTVYLPEVVTQ